MNNYKVVFGPNNVRTIKGFSPEHAIRSWVKRQKRGFTIQFVSVGENFAYAHIYKSGHLVRTLSLTK